MINRSASQKDLFVAWFPVHGESVIVPRSIGKIIYRPGKCEWSRLLISNQLPL